MHEKQLLIFNVGKELFTEKGFKQTNIQAIAQQADIGVGTFYNFFESKEQLFFEVFLSENRKLKETVVSSVDFDGEPIIVAKAIVHKLFSGMQESPILREWFNPDVNSKLSIRLSEDETGTAYNDFSYTLFINLIALWQKRGQIRSDHDPDFILALFNSLSFVDLHKADIGNQYFPEVIDTLVESIVKQLM
jgi:AcrR family transcriptional regulator